MSPPISLIESIQSLLTPAVMISSTALFFMGVNARQSAVFVRIRSLNDEKRKLIDSLEKQAENPRENYRYLNIEQQINGLVTRIWYIRNCIICYTVAVIFFVLTSLGIGLNFSVAHLISAGIPLGLFVMGMLSVLAGSFCLVLDEWISYAVILQEVKE